MILLYSITIKRNISIISGGQSGVDRSALDFAIRNNIPHSGWCPKNRWAEDGKIPDKYNLQETPEPAPIHRTRKNITVADGTLIIFDKKMDQGTLDTLKFCVETDKLFLIINLSEEIDRKAFTDWLANGNIKLLNIAGSRESSSPGIYKKSLSVLEKLLLD